MINSAEGTDNEERDDNQTAFHASVSFLLFLIYNRFHSPHAHKMLPMTAARVMIAASIPSVCNPLTMASFPPTSIPSRNSSTHLRSVIILCIHVNRDVYKRQLYSSLKKIIILHWID